MIERFHELEPYSLEKSEKDKLLVSELLELTDFHYNNCEFYKNIVNGFGYSEQNIKTVEDFPFLPVRLFKELDLKSIPDDEVFKIMTSSGTTGQAVSKIYVDKDTAILQQKVMIRILSDYIGKNRVPILVIDSPSTVKNRVMFSARGAAIIGLNIVAKKMVFALNDDMTINWEVVNEFFENYGKEKFLIFGFTFIVWQHLYQELVRQNKKFDLPEAFLMTGGGWKKLISEQISRDEFKKRINDVLGIKHFLDHYGMVEQTGCIYAECECGHLHASIYSDVIPRRFNDFSPCEIGEEGILQTISVLPHSYPGHSLLTEDMGRVLGVDDCPCGRKGKYIEISGRIKQAEIRGCSDTYASKF